MHYATYDAFHKNLLRRRIGVENDPIGKRWQSRSAIWRSAHLSARLGTSPRPICSGTMTASVTRPSNSFVGIARRAGVPFRCNDLRPSEIAGKLS
jgi:hypothetical protein